MPVGQDTLDMSCLQSGEDCRHTDNRDTVGQMPGDPPGRNERPVATLDLKIKTTRLGSSVQVILTSTQWGVWGRA